MVLVSPKVVLGYPKVFPVAAKVVLGYFKVVLVFATVSPVCLGVVPDLANLAPGGTCGVRVPLCV